MENYITLDNVASIVTFIAPGYFALKAYSLVYSKGEREFSQQLVVSAVCSLPIVSAYNFLWHSIFHGRLAPTPSAGYALPLVCLSIAAGLLIAYARRMPLVRTLARRLHLPAPEEDFIRLQFSKLRKGEAVAVTLKNDEIFSGTPQGGSTFKGDEPHHYYFSNIAWFDEKAQKWNERPGSLIIDLNEVSYIATPRPLPDDQ